ncbi:Tyrosine-protein phosphatase non-receptor type 5,Receptor-type tyrosine-protein phosphatase R,Receptor-type tyrosine-protein phosphatase eta,Tyrosine-protein phosphatase non-receptor type 7,Receptor-type tyrosine-protein phosphatase beta [Mytilus coruscus]|uniref:protein-tyrosine-phosphatase n=1 Tax=Mytilus coruscus TaxID=42192 RepID=A0A6J8BAZ9_MYTCO|nr:Tyrosine-protein phosphatase non-receptor type 5,Receptor-type tyrosine-protein phosphatase R,Receptor-type tyrosine-protein phosphatase eta,Tyrosine-protein phosphatase non-receptor type 7,Receptor-type tyrosine-protein phosphatase beta [Mytilus coruscus]
MHVSKFVNLPGSIIDTSVAVKSQFIADQYDPRSNTQSVHENLALKGIARQKTTFTDAGGIVHSASLAVEGPANNEWRDGCSSTLPDQAEAWWGLFLPELAYITNVVFYFRGDDPEETNEFRLYLSNSSEHDPFKSLCYTDLKIPGYPESTHDKDCNTLTKNVYFFNRNRVVVICYIEVNGCFKGTWGTNCTELCPSNCISNHCDIGNGTCVWGCDSRHCVHNRCNKHTGICTDGCVAGRAGQYCSKYNLASYGTATQYPLNPNRPASLSVDGNRTNGMCSRTTGPVSYLQVDTGSLSVVTTVYLTFGDTPITTGDDVVYCSNISDSWVDGIVLYKGERPTKNINVFTVCRYITYVPPAANGVDVCEFEIGGCPLGRYGVNCENFCHCNGPCDLVTGNCTSGCLDGWVGYKCDIACASGNFGSGCSRPCSANCLNPPCNHVSGECTGGCIKGWEGYNCTKECDDGYFGKNCSQTCFGCISNKCDKPNGKCSNSSGCKPGYVNGQYCNQECEDWQFGIDCAKVCYCRSKPCNKFDGVCSDGECKKGWHGKSCDKECDDGFYGFNCKMECTTCLNKSCEILEGNCSYGCIDRYEGVKCKVATGVMSNGNNSGAAVGGGIAATIVIIILVAIIIIIYRRKSKPESEKYLSNQDKITGGHENTYCNHKDKLKTEDIYLNLESEQDSDNVKHPMSGKKESKTSVIEVKDEYPEEYDEEEEENVYYNDPSEQKITKYKVRIEDLQKVINEKRKDDGFKNEYEILPKGLVHAHTEGSKEENKVKNRFLSTWPYDHSRVVLTGDTKHDYINASYINSYDREKAYIASQGPKKNTLRDFWHMVWQANVCKIVMVTKLEEERRKKCEPYWPKTVNKATMVDNYRLTMTEEIYHTIYVYRLIILHNKTNQQERNIHHFHFTQWPDHGVPDSIKLVNFYRKVKSKKCDKNGPMVVHCSAGVGRTGTFIAVDALYEHGKKVGYVDIMEYVQMMRKDRMNMIQTHEQYLVVFEALLELFTVPNTSIQKNDFCEYIQLQENKTLPTNQTIFREEFQRLRTLRPSYSSNAFTAANCKENKSKNSTKTVLAHDKYRPYLMSYGKTRSDYINAVIIPGYAVDSKMFATQCPLVETVIDFWTMMYDHSSRIIVLLDPGNKGAPLWLEKKEMLQFDDFRIVKETENAQEEFQLTLNHTKNKEQISIKVFTAEDWTITNAVPSPEYMLDFLHRVQNYWETQKGPITVVCSDGCSKSGLFVALKLVLEKMQIDGEIDIFQVVREIQTRRPEFLVEFDQYEYCYQCIKFLLGGDSGDSLYANT